jgi:hypothetical protein
MYRIWHKSSLQHCCTCHTLALGCEGGWKSISGRSETLKALVAAFHFCLGRKGLASNRPVQHIDSLDHADLGL